MIIVAGSVRIAPEKLAAARDRVAAYVAASRADAGCVVFSFAEDIADPGLIRVFEIWADEASLARHFETPHVKAWREIWPSLGLSDRKLSVYQVGTERPL